MYDCSDPELAADWAGLARTVVVVKTVRYRGQTSQRRHYYRTSLKTLPAADLAAGIRGHWGIENKLHRTRDVHFGQDSNGIHHPVAAATLALLNTLARHYLLATLSPSIRFAQLSLAQNFKQLLASTRT